jgi:hypothetical protein
VYIRVLIFDKRALKHIPNPEEEREKASEVRSKFRGLGDVDISLLSELLGHGSERKKGGDRPSASGKRKGRKSPTQEVSELSAKILGVVSCPTPTRTIREGSFAPEKESIACVSSLIAPFLCYQNRSSCPFRFLSAIKRMSFLHA